MYPIFCYLPHEMCLFLPWRRGHWIGGNSILVQTGDIIDRGNASGPIFRSLLRLQDPWTLTVSCEGVFFCSIQTGLFLLNKCICLTKCCVKQTRFLMGPI